jgi:hypothetical protein
MRLWKYTDGTTLHLRKCRPIPRLITQAIAFGQFDDDYYYGSWYIRIGKFMLSYDTAS